MDILSYSLAQQAIDEANHIFYYTTHQEMLLAPVAEDRDLAIVFQDETQGGSASFYIFKDAWTLTGSFSSSASSSILQADTLAVRNGLTGLKDGDTCIVWSDIDNEERTSMYYYFNATWRYVGTFGITGGAMFAYNVKSVALSFDASAENATVTWVNPTSDLFLKRSVFISDTIDLTNTDFTYCQTNAQLISDTLGTGSGAADQTTFLSVAGKTYYVRIFTTFDLPENAVSTGAGVTEEAQSTVYKGNVSSFTATKDGSNFLLQWSDPQDELYTHTLVRYQLDSYPTSPAQGIDGGQYTRDSHSTVPLSLSNLTQEKTYYVTLFPVDKYGNVSTETGNRISFSTFNVYGFNYVTGERTSEAVGKTQIDFDSIYPWNSMRRCVVDGTGANVYYLNEEDSSLKEDLTPAVLDGTDGDVMVEIPAFYYRIHDNQIDIAQSNPGGFDYMPSMFIGAFASTLKDGVFKSVANALPETNQTISQLRFSSEKSTGWGSVDIHAILAVRMLFAVEYGTLNAQQAIGSGLVNGTAIAASGGTISLGNHTGAAANGSVSYRGLEDIYGNVYEFADGIVATDISYYTATGNYSSFQNDDSVGSYVSSGIVPITDSGYISEFENILFLAKSVLGNNLEKSGDVQNSHNAGEMNLMVWGGDYQSADKAGLFHQHFGVVFGNKTMLLKEETTSGKTFSFSFDGNGGLGSIDSLEIK